MSEVIMSDMWMLNMMMFGQQSSSIAIHHSLLTTHPPNYHLTTNN
ncbi:hypothetical protein [Aridibaculum aurantiacum]|nr:hypothetical protein [Aridibaculum aurantiacum]